MNPSHRHKKSLYSYKTQYAKRRTTSTIIGDNSMLSLHKTSNSIGTPYSYYNAQIEQIKLEIQERLKEQKNREKTLQNMMKADNEPIITEMYSETARKNDIKNSESTLNESDSYFLCIKKIFSKCFS